MRRETDFLTILLNNIHEGLMILSPDGEILLLNQEMGHIFEMLGCGPLEIGENVFTKNDDDAAARLRQAIKKALVDGTSKRTFEEFLAPEGNTVFIEANYFPVKSDQTINHIIIIFRDVTSDKIFERRITDLANNLSSLIERASAIIIGTDSRGYITDWNKYSTERMGFQKNEVFARRLSEVLMTQETKSAFSELLESVMNGNSIRNYELAVRAKNGSTIILLLSATPRVSPQSAVTGAIFVGQDITELTTYRQSLEMIVEQRTEELKNSLAKEREVAEMKNRFVSMVSHEFRTPLATINFASGYVRKFREKLAGEDIDKKLEQIEQQVRHMTHMLEDVLTIGKADQAKIKAAYTQVDLKEFITNLALEVSEANNNTHKINVSIELDKTSYPTDEKLLRNIFINLLSNAIKYSPEKNEVLWTAQENGKSIEFKVKDHGIGIHPDDINQIFDPFHRASNVGQISGAGLGLSIVKRAVGLLQGELSISSEPHEGTEFVVKLPKAYAQ